MGLLITSVWLLGLFEGNTYQIIWILLAKRTNASYNCILDQDIDIFKKL